MTNENGVVIGTRKEHEEYWDKHATLFIDFGKNEPPRPIIVSMYPISSSAISIPEGIYPIGEQFNQQLLKIKKEGVLYCVKSLNGSLIKESIKIQITDDDEMKEYKKLWNDSHIGWPQNQFKIFELMKDMDGKFSIEECCQISNIDINLWKKNLKEQEEICKRISNI
jgi:hypothetical protein